LDDFNKIITASMRRDGGNKMKKRVVITGMGIV